MKKLFWYTFLLLGLSFFSCEKDNFDHNESSVTSFEPDVTALDPGIWEFQLDTLDIQLDSSWFYHQNLLGGLAGTTIFPETTTEPQYGMYMGFYTGSETLQFEEGAFPLTELTSSWAIYDEDTGWENRVDEWTEDQIDGTVTITTVGEFYDSFFNVYRPEISGFAEATLTNPDGTTFNFTAAFNRIK